MYPDKIFTLTGLFLFSVLTLLPVVSKSPALRRAERFVIGLTESRGFSVLLMFLGVIAIRVLFLPLLGVPVPGIHDEFSYLLLGDTFAHGRLTNPTHPLWVSFETFNVNWIPTYCSMYPPAQGLFLAVGQLLGHPWIGVLLSNAGMCASVVWMLQAWMPSRWAFFGGFLTALQFSVSSYWMNGYWGGAAAATGGALVLGGLGRIRRSANARNALLLGLGIALLATSRPFEGLLFCIPTGVYLLWWLRGKIKTKDNFQTRMNQVLLPLLASMILLGGFLAYYNWRLTGNPLLMAHVLNTKTYETSARYFLWQPHEQPPHYRNLQFEGFYNEWSPGYYRRSWEGVSRVTKEKVIMLATYFFGRPEWPLLLFVPFLFRDRKLRLLLITLLVVGIGVFIVIWAHPHYAAPLTGVVFALVVQAMRHLNTVETKGRPIGALAVRVMVIVMFAVVLDRALDGQRDVDWRRASELEWRAEVGEQLRNAAGKHLVMVRYRKDHNYHQEWVYNGAEIDAAKVLWARELDGDQNRRLFAYFKDRHIWVIQPDEVDRRLRSLKLYPGIAAQPFHQAASGSP